MTGFLKKKCGSQVLPLNRLLISLDVGTVFGSFQGADERVYEISVGGLTIHESAFNPLSFSSSWQGADLNALWAVSTQLAGSVRWQTSAISVLEDTASVTLAIERVVGSAGSITLSWATASGTATGGSDFIVGEGNLVMSDGQTAAQVIISLIDDALIEGTESFMVTINGATNGAMVTTPAEVEISILDNEDYIFANGFE